MHIELSYNIKKSSIFGTKQRTLSLLPPVVIGLSVGRYGFTASSYSVKKHKFTAQPFITTFMCKT